MSGEERGKKGDRKNKDNGGSQSLEDKVNDSGRLQKEIVKREFNKLKTS